MCVRCAVCLSLSCTFTFHASARASPSYVFFMKVSYISMHFFCREFVKDAGRGGKGIVPIQSLPAIENTQAWDGKDAEVIEEDEFSLEDLMSES